MASSTRTAVSDANNPPLPARNMPISAIDAITSATTTSSSVKPRGCLGLPRGTGLPGIGDADPAGQPIDADRDRALAIADRDPAAGRAAVRIESNAAGP